MGRRRRMSIPGRVIFMNFRQVFWIFPLALGGLVGYAAADEPLSMKIEMRSWDTRPNGPRSMSWRSTLFRGPPSLGGRKSQIRLQTSIQGELRSQGNELLADIGDKGIRIPASPGKRAACNLCHQFSTAGLFRKTLKATSLSMT